MENISTAELVPSNRKTEEANYVNTESPLLGKDTDISLPQTLKLLNIPSMGKDPFASI